MWAVSSDGWSCTIVSMHQLGQMLWPVCLPVSTQFPYHAHQYLVSSFHLSIGLSMIRWSPNLLYVHKLAKLSDDVAFKVGPSVLRSLAGALKIKMYPCHRNLATVFAVWLGVTYAMMCFVKWLQKAKRFTTFGGWSNSIMVSMLVKSTCNNSKGVVTMIICIGVSVWLPSCWMHCSQLLITFCICVAMPGHQNQTCSKHSICSWPWCLASQWHPVMADIQWAMETTNHKTSSNSPLGVWQW